MVQTRTQQMEAKLDALLKMFEADHRTVEERFAILDESIARLEVRLSEHVEQVEARLDHGIECVQSRAATVTAAVPPATMTHR